MIKRATHDSITSTEKAVRVLIEYARASSDFTRSQIFGPGAGPAEDPDMPGIDTTVELYGSQVETLAKFRKDFGLPDNGSVELMLMNYAMKASPEKSADIWDKIRCRTCAEKPAESES